MGARDERFPRLKRNLAPVCAYDLDWFRKIDEQHALRMRQLAPRGEAACTLDIVAVAVDQSCQLGGWGNRRGAPSINAIVMDANRSKTRFERGHHGSNVIALQSGSRIKWKKWRRTGLPRQGPASAGALNASTTSASVHVSVDQADCIP
jgi:hypothetical protein